MDENYFAREGKLILLCRSLINKLTSLWRSIQASVSVWKWITQAICLRFKQVVSHLNRFWNVGISAPAGKILNNRNLKSIEYKKNESIFRVDLQSEEPPVQSVTSEYSYLQERKALSLKKSVTREYRNNSK